MIGVWGILLYLTYQIQVGGLGKNIFYILWCLAISIQVVKASTMSVISRFIVCCGLL